MQRYTIKGNIVDIISESIFPAEIIIENGKISDIIKLDTEQEKYILPGLIDAHIHIESSMLTPSDFAAKAVIHGTVATVSDPHEIANVLGIDGVKYMIDNGKKVPFKFYFGCPSCVPATGFETAGFELNSEQVKELLSLPEVLYLSETMNFPGVIYSDTEVMNKIHIAKEHNKPIDGHIPGISGEDLKKYIYAGITTDHECFTIEEAIEKIGLGMKILIREGSAAKNFDALAPLINSHNEMVMLCSDDLHPNDLLNGHINLLVKKALEQGFDLFKVLKAAILNPILHYKLNVGLLQKGDSADFIVVDDLKKFKIEQTYIEGILAADNGKSFIANVSKPIVNNFNKDYVSPDDFKVEYKTEFIKVIEAIDGQLITNSVQAKAKNQNGFIVSDIENDILKIAVIDRYNNGQPAIGFIKNFGLKKGAIATSVAHDSHNIIAVGTSDEAIAAAVNKVISYKGGMSVNEGISIDVLPLPIAGIISDANADITGLKYIEIEKKAKALGSQLRSPFMTLSFMALLVIPSLKLSDKGLFDGTKFQFTDLYVD